MAVATDPWILRTQWSPLSVHHHPNDSVISRDELAANQECWCPQYYRKCTGASTAVMQNSAETWCGMQWGDYYRRVLWQKEQNTFIESYDWELKQKHVEDCWAIRVLPFSHYRQWSTRARCWDRVSCSFLLRGKLGGDAKHLWSGDLDVPCLPPLRLGGQIEQTTRILAEEILGDIWCNYDLGVLHVVFGEFSAFKWHLYDELFNKTSGFNFHQRVNNGPSHPSVGISKLG